MLADAAAAADMAVSHQSAMRVAYSYSSQVMTQLCTAICTYSSKSVTRRQAAASSRDGRSRPPDEYGTRTSAGYDLFVITLPVVA